MEHVLRQCLICLRLAQILGLDEADREVVYYAALLAWVGCHVDAYEQAKWFGDDTVLKADFRHVDFHAAAGPLFMLRHLGAGRPMVERARLGVAFAGDGRRVAGAILENHWLAADGLADAAIAVARQRRGTQFDPQIVDIFTRQGPSLFAGLNEASSWDAVIAAEPALGVRLAGAEFDAALEAVADFTDVKSPYTIGHSRGVADLAGEAARIGGLSGQAATLVRRAGLVHDLGRLGVPNTIWDKRGSLSHAETERVRLHPYLTERMLASSAALAPLAAIAVQHHEPPGRLWLPARAVRRGFEP